MIKYHSLYTFKYIESIVSLDPVLHRGTRLPHDLKHQGSQERPQHPEKRGPAGSRDTGDPVQPGAKVPSSLFQCSEQTWFHTKYHNTQRKPDSQVL